MVCATRKRHVSRKCAQSREYRGDGTVRVMDVEYEFGLKQYVVGYRPQRLTKKSSDQDREGYETRLEEFFEMIGRKEAEKLGVRHDGHLHLKHGHPNLQVLTI